MKKLDGDHPAARAFLQGRLVAMDISESRLEPLQDAVVRQRLERLVQIQASPNGAV